MKKTKRNRVGETPSIKKTKKGWTRAAEHVNNLLQLHKLQGIPLNRLDKEA